MAAERAGAGPPEEPQPAPGPPGPGHIDQQSWQSIIRWLREDEILRGWLTDAEATLLASDRINELPIWKALLQYQGFDIKRILRNMFRAREDYMQRVEFHQVEVQLRVGQREVGFIYTNRETMAFDIEFLIFLFAERGSTNAKYVQKSIPELGQITDWLIEKYGIDIHVNLPLTALDPDLVTLPRIVACFPAKIFEYYHRDFGNTLTTFHDIGIDEPGNLSRSILCPHFTALIPREVVRINYAIQMISFLVHVVTDDILHKKTGNYTELENIFIYYSAEYYTPGTPQRARVSFCRRMGLMLPDQPRFIQVLEGLRDHAERRIRILRPDDPQLERTIRDIKRLA